MQPTYSTLEAIRLMATLDYDGLFQLGELIREEKKRYTLQDLRLLADLLQMFLTKARPK